MFVTECRPMAISSARMNPSISFCPARNLGVTKDRIAFREQIQVEVNKTIDRVPQRFGSYATFWAGDNKPTFSFVTLARDKGGEAFKTISTSRSAVIELKVHHTALINDLRQETCCQIIIPHQKYEDENPMEIAVKGPRDGVEVCLRKIEGILNLYVQADEAGNLCRDL
ncbi:hypothetical protein VTL71DRAFT_4466 [Oculimacula yallundae]|uniref:K Homology domain-containing protein n=1 Tax=Oculimacula yallundae TaxID=86028 RepID=A0ABR4C2Q3_9HELO